ncbi:MAG: DUF4388 domain-containing protein, partial [Gemmatimonadetes bacterium]|nr:DUF4388 domain-containing protein [Gemmatimonadota bacterium]
LERQLRFQLEETIYDLMGWQEGQFRFEETSDLPRGRVAVRVRTESLIMEGARRVDEWGRLESKIPSLEAIPVLAPADEREAPPLELSGEEWEVLAEVDGERDLRQIAAHLGRSSFEIAEIVYRLVSAGVVRVQQHPVEHPEERLGARATELEPGSAEAHYHLGFAAVRTGELDRAAQAWHTFLRLAPKGQRPRSVTRALAAVEELTQILARAPG